MYKCVKCGLETELWSSAYLLVHPCKDGNWTRFIKEEERDTVLCSQYPRMYFEGMFNIPKNARLACVHQSVDCNYTNLMIKKFRLFKILK